MSRNFKESLGFQSELSPESQVQQRDDLLRYIVLKLIANGLPHPELPTERAGSLEPEQLIGTYHERLKLLDAVRCPADQRIEAFLARHMSDCDLEAPLRLPDRTVILDQHGIAREVELACPPLKALLYIMAFGSWEGHDVNSPEVRSLFTLESLIESDWYQERLKTRQQNDIALWSRHVETLAEAISNGHDKRLDSRLAMARSELDRVSTPEYLKSLRGTIGTDPATFAPAPEPHSLAAASEV